MSGKGDKDRTRDIPRYRENMDTICWKKEKNCINCPRRHICDVSEYLNKGDGND